VDDKDAVVATVKDYFEGWFDGDAERMERALHPGLAKTGIVVDVAGVPSDDLCCGDPVVRM
jgi:hypothetical protein